MIVAANHPALPGHFPGNPVVPGVVLLDEVVVALEQQLGRGVRLTAVPNAKFLSPLLPEQAFSVAITLKQEGSASFTVSAGEIRILTGSLSYE